MTAENNTTTQKLFTNVTLTLHYFHSKATEKSDLFCLISCSTENVGLQNE